MDGGDELSVVNAVDADKVRAEVGDPEGRVVAADDTVGGFRADEVGAADLVGPGVDLRDGVRAEVGDEDFSSVGLHGEVDRGLADVEHGEHMVGGGGGILTGGPGSGVDSEADDHDLMAAGAGDEGLGGVGQNGDVGGAGAAGEGGTEAKGRAGRYRRMRRSRGGAICDCALGASR